MGNFYVNQTLAFDDQAAVAEALRDYQAFIFPPQNKCILVCERLSDLQVIEWAQGLSGQPSTALNCSVLNVLNHDDDILYYSLYRNGELIDEYDSSPGYFEGGSAVKLPTGGSAEKLCGAFGSPNATEVLSILHDGDYSRFLLAVDRHLALAKAVGLPEYAAGLGFNYLSQGERPEGISGEILEVRSKAAYKDFPFPDEEMQPTDRQK